MPIGMEPHHKFVVHGWRGDKGAFGYFLPGDPTILFYLTIRPRLAGKPYEIIVLPLGHIVHDVVLIVGKVICRVFHLDAELLHKFSAHGLIVVFACIDAAARRVIVVRVHIFHEQNFILPQDETLDAFAHGVG